MQTAIASKHFTSAQDLNPSQKRGLSLQLLKTSTSVSELARSSKVSRTFLQRQKAKALQAIAEAFEESQESDVLFHLPVTKVWIESLVLCLALHCKGSIRGIQKTLKDVLDYSLSLGQIVAIQHKSCEEAMSINDNENLEAIQLAATDEIFHLNKPILSGVEIRSLYCFLLSKESMRDEDTWALNAWDLQKQGLEPERFIADNAKGLRKGLETVFPNVPRDGDTFHAIKDLMELRRFFRNTLKTSISTRTELEAKVAYKPTPEKEAQLALAQKDEAMKKQLSETIDTLVSWLQHDVLSKEGPCPRIRHQLYDFIVHEFKKLEAIHPHRIKDMRIALENQKHLLLAFTEVLDNKFRKIAAEHQVVLEQVWVMCELCRCKTGSDRYAIRCLPLDNALGERFDTVEDAVMNALNTTERTSSMVENLHSRLKPYLIVRKNVEQKFLNLIRFYFNHTHFLRSEKEERRQKTPAEILFKQSQPHWLEMLGLPRFKRAA